VGIFVGMITDAYAQKPEESLDWSIKTSKKIFYPGEPVLLTLNISNTRQQEEKIDFGVDGIEAFSMEIRDDSNKMLRKGGKIERSGFSTRGPLQLPPGKIGQKSIVLNQWCSTVLPRGKYRVICRIEYRLRSEATKIPDTDPPLFKAGPLHITQLDLDIEIVKPDISKYKEILDNLARYKLKQEGQSFTDWRQERDLAREMIAFTEWELAVPYQLNVLKVERYTWLKLDLINSLARSGTLEAAKGLMEIVSDNADHPERIEDIIREDFQIQSPIENKNKVYLTKIENTESVSIHLRGRDYIKKPETLRLHLTCDHSYYERCLAYINDKIIAPHIFIFSDDPEWAKSFLQIKQPCTFVGGNSWNKTSYEDMRLMSLCKHNIIANSTFSWWGAWLNQNYNKIVIAPKRWFNDEKKNSETKELIPEEWIRL